MKAMALIIAALLLSGPADAASRTREYWQTAISKPARDLKAKRAFQRAHPCPSTGRSRGNCPGYVVDHIASLKRGGLDHPSNMQWQTVVAAKEKDRWE